MLVMYKTTIAKTVKRYKQLNDRIALIGHPLVPLMVQERI